MPHFPPKSLLLLLSAVVFTFLVAQVVNRHHASGTASPPSTPSPDVTRSAPRPSVTATNVTHGPLSTATSPVVALAPLPGLHVHGAAIVNGKGEALRLLGVNRSGSEFKCIQLGTSDSRGWGIFDGPTGVSSARAIASWHANVVRVPLNEDCWLDINGVNPAYGGASYRAAVQHYVDALHRAGLYAILDLHWSAPGDIPAASQQPMPDVDHSPAFWKSVAGAFKHNPNVAFDLYNEPFLYTSYLHDPTQDPWSCWLAGCAINQYLTGGNPYTHGQIWRAAGMQDLIDAIRSTGARNLILVPGLDWANDVSGWLAHEPSDPVHNLAVSWHSYPAEGCDTQACWSRVVTPLAHRVPVVVGETGDNVCTAPTYDPTFLAWADHHGISYLGWTWNQWQDCKNILIRGYDGTPTNGYGQYFHDHLASLAAASHLSSATALPALSPEG